MATQRTRWSPDTCGCVIDLTWDDASPDPPTQTLVAACPLHTTPAAVLAENQRKNRALALAAIAAPAKTATWAFDGSRQVVVTVDRITAAERTALQGALTAAGLTTVRLG